MAVTPLSQAIYKGLDPSVYQPLQQLETGDALTQAGMDASPTSKWGALGRVAQALSGAYLTNTSRSRLADTIAGGKKQAMDDLMAALQPRAAVPSAAPQSAAPRPAAQPAPARQAAVAPPQAAPQAAAAAPAPANGGQIDPETFSAMAKQMADARANEPAVPFGAPAPAAPSPQEPAAAPAAPAAGPDYGKSISAIESGGRYDLLGPVTKSGDRAYGKYQVMGQNIPEWTQAILGKRMTPAEFLASPEAQDAVFKGKFGEYAEKYGPEGAAKAWFAGEKGMHNPNAKDQLGTTVQAYADRFMSGIGGQPGPQAIEAAASGHPVQVAQAASPTMSDARGIDVHRLLAVMQNPYADEATKAIVGKLLLQQLDPGEDTYGVIGEDAFGGKKYGFVNPKAHTINGQSVDDAAGKNAASSGGPFDNIDSTKTGDEYLKQFPPEIQAGVKDYIDGRKMPTGNPRRSDIIRQVAGKYGADIGVPADDASFGARRTMLNDLQKTTPGSIGGQITSLRTAANHLATMAQDAEDLGNVDMGNSWLSRGVNTIRGLSTEQAAKMEKLKNDALRYGQEITKFYSGSPGGEAERQHFLEALDAAKSPKELAAVIDAERQLIPGRGEELQNRINNTLGPRLAEKYRVHSPESEHSIQEAGDVVKRMRGDPDAPPKPGKKGEAAKATAPAAPKQISTKAEYDALPPGSTYIAPDGSTRTKK